MITNPTSFHTKKTTIMLTQEQIEFFLEKATMQRFGPGRASLKYTMMELISR